jgi:formylmethanofuran dehydrogenase subunit B
MMVITRTEAALVADTVLMVGPGVDSAWPELKRELVDRRMGLPSNQKRSRILRLCPEIPARERREEERWVGTHRRELPGLLAALRAILAGRPIAKLRERTRIEEVAAALRQARFGVALWSAAELDVLTIEMLCGLVEELNRNTRFSGLPSIAADQAAAVLEVCGWLTGFPMRTGFGRGFPEHDPWRFSASRLVKSGEADCAFWISAYRAAAPEWDDDVPIVALTGAEAKFPRPPRVHIAVGKPGVDHDAVEQFAATGTLARTEAKHKSDAIPVADAVHAIASALAKH